jgi:hypothetical protein
VTASTAIERVSKKERESIMAKRRSCRRTTDENIIHEKAVKMRKMTDEQLVHYVEDRVEKARSEGFHCGKDRYRKKKPVSVDAIVKEIGGTKGIGPSKLPLIRIILEKHLEGNLDG